jgi:predicted secreted protein
MVVISYIRSSEDGRLKKVKRRLSAKDQVEQIVSKRIVKSLANFCAKRIEKYPN